MQRGFGGQVKHPAKARLNSPALRREFMKHSVVNCMSLFTALAGLVLALTGLAYAGEDNHATVTMTGVICDSKCVVQNTDQATCNKKCSEQSGEYVFLTGQNALQISNPEMVKPFAGKRAKVKCAPSKDKPGSMEVFEIAPPTY
jgi:hypothetical protein